MGHASGIRRLLGPPVGRIPTAIIHLIAVTVQRILVRLIILVLVLFSSFTSITHNTLKNMSLIEGRGGREAAGGVLASARYGKDKVRVFRVVRDAASKVHDVVEYNVTVLVEGAIETRCGPTRIVAPCIIKPYWQTASREPIIPSSWQLTRVRHFSSSRTSITISLIKPHASY